MPGMIIRGVSPGETYNFMGVPNNKAPEELYFRGFFYLKRYGKDLHLCYHTFQKGLSSFSSNGSSL